MSRFKQITIEEFINYIQNVKVTRKINEIHIHHTWKPDYEDWKRTKEDNPNKLYKIIEGMYNYHVKSRGWSDIGQNLTIDPDGGIWLCRNINKIPASISGRNSHGYGIEIIGNFDKGHDEMTYLQSQAVLSVCEALRTKLFGRNIKFTDSNIKYHREYSSKTCPGSGFKSKDTFLNILNEVRFTEVEEADRSKTETVRVLQSLLNAYGICALVVDGILGKETMKEIANLAQTTGTKDIKDKMKQFL